MGELDIIQPSTILPYFRVLVSDIGSGYLRDGALLPTSKYVMKYLVLVG